METNMCMTIGVLPQAKGFIGSSAAISSQEQSTSRWENIYVLFSQPGESPILFRDSNFSQEGRFVTNKEGVGTSFQRQAGETRIFLRKGVFACQEKRQWKKKKIPLSAAHGGRGKKISQEKQKRQILTKRP